MKTSLADLLAKLTFRAVARTLFRVRVRGSEYAPSSGPALLVSNHLTFLDAFLIGSCVEPVVRFLIWRPYYEKRLLRWGCRIGKAIPIGTEPDSAARAIKISRGLLESGEVLCIFAEGEISRTGDLLPFQRGLEWIARDSDTPIIPVHLGGLWESSFSFRAGRFFGMQIPRFRHPVTVSFGPHLPPWSSAQEVRCAVERLSQRPLIVSHR